MKKNHRRLFALFAAVSITAAACGSSDDDEAEETTTTEAAEEETTTTEAEEEETTTTEAAEEDDSDDAMADDEADDGAADEPGTIVEVASEAGDFTTLVAAVEAAGLTETLSGGSYTVFAPTDAAFDAALTDLDMTADELLADTELLTSVLTYHVIEGVVPSSDVVTLDGQSVATVNGAEVTITIDGETVMVNEATVTAVDVEASNGVIHVIDSVLLPPAG